MEKYIYKNTKIQSVFFVFYLYFSFFIFTKKKTKTYQKIRKKIRMQLLKNTKYKKKYESTISKIQKKNTNQKFQKNKIQRKDKFKNKPESQPRVHCGNQETNCKKRYKTNQLYFPNPAVLILYFGVVFLVFFCIFKYWQKTLL